MRVLQGNPPWASLWIRHKRLRPVPPWSFQQLGRPVGNPPYHPDGPPWLAGLGLCHWYTYLVYPQHLVSREYKYPNLILPYLESQASSCHCKYTRIIENRQRGTFVPDDMEQAHIKMTGQADNEHLGISFIYHLYSFLF
jgi:hypothetical protein